jgi:hypothetical protein
MTSTAQTFCDRAHAVTEQCVDLLAFDRGVSRIGDASCMAPCVQVL